MCFILTFLHRCSLSVQRWLAPLQSLQSGLSQCFSPSTALERHWWCYRWTLGAGSEGELRECFTGSAGWSLVLLAGRSPEPFNGQHSPGELFQVVKSRLLAWPQAEAGPVLVLKCQHRQVLSVPLAQGPELQRLCLVNWSRLHFSSRTQELSLAPNSVSG